MFTTPDWAITAKLSMLSSPISAFCDLHRHQYSLLLSLGGVITNDPKERVARQAYRFVLVGTRCCCYR